MKIHTDNSVETVLASYPPKAQKKLSELRALVVAAANDLQLPVLEETLKWGEPSYLTKHGSTVRMDWKPKNPDRVSVFFKCTSKLVPAFKDVYPNTFLYDGNRALHFDLDAPIPATELKQCIATALQYHKVKHLPNLGLTGK